MKNTVVIKFKNEEQAKAFWQAFSDPENRRRDGIDIIMDCIPAGIDVIGVEKTKIRKYDYYIEIV